MATNDIKYTLNAQLADNSVTTQYSTNGKTLLKTPRSVSQTIYLGEAPAGGGDDGGSTEGGGGLDENPYFPLVAARAKEENAQAIPICAKTEEDIAGSTQEEKIAFLQEMGIESTGLDKLIKASYELLGLISFLTDGKKECRAWTIRKGTKAPQAAGKIHSDFERGFIRAQVIAYKDLEDADFNYAAVKAKGLQRTEGKEYVVNDGDVIEFLFNV